MPSQLQKSPHPSHPINQYVVTRRLKRQDVKAIEYADWMFNWRDQYIIIVMTLNYEKADRKDISLERLLDDRNYFISLFGKIGLLKGVQGYIMRVEFGGKGGGHHLHCILFYDVTYSDLSDVEISDEIGETYWHKVVTNREGWYGNSNKEVPKMTHPPYGNAVGHVTRLNASKRQSLRNYIRGYLVKNQQHVPDNHNVKSHLFVTGQVPEWAKYVSQDEFLFG